MQALVFHGPEDVRVERVPDPKLSDADGAILRVETAAICGSDLHLYHGTLPAPAGFVVGHEFVGEVVETGSGVSRFRVGDRVLASGVIGCAQCPSCLRGQVVRCERSGQRVFGMNGELPGGQAEAVAVPGADWHLRPIPDGMDTEQAVLLTDILPTGYFGAANADIQPGHSVAIVGLGPVGIMALQCAQLFGPARVFGLDLVPERLANAEKLGAIPVDASQDPLVQILEHTGGRGVDAVIEAVGARETIQSAIALVRPGGVVSVIGVNLEFEFPFPMGPAFMKDLTFRIGLCPVPETWEALFPLVASGRLQPESVITHRMGLSEGSEAYRLFASRRDGVRKIVLDPAS